MGEKNRDILSQIYARHLSILSQTNFTFREIEIIACLIHTRGMKKIALLLNIAPKTVETHIRNINLKINCNSQDEIIKFIEKSGKIEIIREFYNAIVQSAGTPTNERTASQESDEKEEPPPQDPLTAVTAKAALTVKRLKKPTDWMHPKFSRKAYVFPFLATLIICSAIYIVPQYCTNIDDASIRSDLIMPMNAVLLERSDLLNQIDKKFHNGSGIQSLALIGPGGAGKTITAREYAQQQHASVVWEINAENRRGLHTSFENFATALAKTKDDKQELIQVQEIKEEYKREAKLIQFVKNRLRAFPGWFLIFDNVEQLADIQPYLPHDPKTWGQGKIILTTQDKNIQNSGQINHTLVIEELDPVQKLSLFTKILSHGISRSFTNTQLEEAKQFLESIPSFPLDVSSAAYYLKANHISYQKYLENLENYNQDFVNVQENLLKGAGPYIKTRYGIITLSLEQLVKNHKDFPDLLLFISLLDSQNIPTSLLKAYKNDSIVDNFMYYLKKYSLIANDSPLSEATFSIHRSIQNISVAHLSEHLKLNQESPVIESIAYALDDYLNQAIEQEDIGQMQTMAVHLEKFLSHSDLLTIFSKALLTSKLGSIYYFINDKKATEVLDNSMQILTSLPLTSENSSRIARALMHIGAVYTELRHDKKAGEALEKAIHIYDKEESKNYADLAWALSHLGNNYRKLGNYEKAKEYLEKSVSLHGGYGSDNKRLARTLALLGGVYRGLIGFQQKAINSLEKSLELYRKHYPNDHFRMGWILTQLGNLYRALGDSQEAKKYLEQALLILKKHLPEDHITIGYTLAYIGNCYKNLGDYQSSLNYLEQSLKIYQKHFNESHLTMGRILFHLARVYKARGNIQEAQKLFDRVLPIYTSYKDEKNIDTARVLKEIAEIYIEKDQLDDAEQFIKKSLDITQPRKHIDVYQSLELLGEIYLKKSTKAPIIGSQHLKTQAVETLNRALKIIEGDFPKNSVHVERIRSKIKEAQK